MSAAAAGHEPLQRRYGGSTAVVNGVRADADAWLRDQGADESTRANAALVISELASNAVQASPGRDFSVTLRRAADAVVVAVANRAASWEIPARRQWGPDEVLAPDGRGLAIVDSLCRHVEVVADDGEVTVSATLEAQFH